MPARQTVTGSPKRWTEIESIESIEKIFHRIRIVLSGNNGGRSMVSRSRIKEEIRTQTTSMGGSRRRIARNINGTTDRLAVTRDGIKTAVGDTLTTYDVGVSFPASLVRHDAGRPGQTANKSNSQGRRFHSPFPMGLGGGGGGGRESSFNINYLSAERSTAGDVCAAFPVSVGVFACQTHGSRESPTDGPRTQCPGGKRTQKDKRPER